MSIYMSAQDEPFCNLVLGQTFNAKTCEEGIHLLDPGFGKEETYVSKTVFRCEVVKNNTDIKDVLEISSDFSLKMEAGAFGAGVGVKYLKERKEEKNVTEVFVYIRHQTVIETLDDRKITLRKDISSFEPNKIGSHYVKSVTHGGEMVVTMKFKSSSVTNRFETKGSPQFDVPLYDCGLFKAHLEKYFRECQNTSGIEINFYGTGEPMISTTPDELLKHIKDFTQRTKQVNGGRGVPIRLGLQPLGNIRVKRGIEYRKNTNLARLMKKFGDQYYDVSSCSAKLEKYVKELDGDDAHPDILALYETAQTVLEQFLKAINELGFDRDEVPFQTSLKAYEKAINGRLTPGKFMAEWRKLFKQHTGDTKSKEDAQEEYGDILAATAALAATVTIVVFLVLRSS